MYRYGYRKPKLLPLLLIFLLFVGVFSGGFYRMFVFVLPLLFAIPFVLFAGAALMFLMRWLHGWGGWRGDWHGGWRGDWRGGWSEFKNKDTASTEKPKRGHDPETGIYYL